MSYEHKDLTGALFKNTRKETHPNLTGQVMVEGVMYWVSGWYKEPKKPNGDRWISLSFKKQ